MGRKKQGKQKKGRRKGDSRRAGRGPTMAEQADRHVLYEASVQNVADEVEFLVGTFREVRGRDPVRLREDFCGTGAAACQWVKSGPLREAVGVDIDPDVLGWGREHHVAALSPEQRLRVRLMEANVLDVDTGAPVDIAVGFNFSYWIFKTRAELLRYFQGVRRALADDGLYFLDVYGGSDALAEMSEKTKHDEFTYVWEQADYDPISGSCLCYIHFKFPDGSRMKRAFTYEWRVWSIPELRELLAEAGFAATTVYWQGTDEDGEGDGVFAPAERGEADPAWIAYIVAEP